MGAATHRTTSRQHGMQKKKQAVWEHVNAGLQRRPWACRSRSAPRLPGLCVAMMARASSQPGLPGPMRLVPPGSKHVHMPALSAVMTWIYVVFAKEMRSTNRTSRGAGLRRFPCLYFPAPRAQNAPKTSCLCLLLRAVYGHFALVDLPQSRKFSPCGALPPAALRGLPPAALRGRPDSTRPGSM